MEYDFSWSEKLAIYAYMEYIYASIKKTCSFPVWVNVSEQSENQPGLPMLHYCVGRCRSDLVISYNQLYPN